MKRIAVFLACFLGLLDYSYGAVPQQRRGTAASTASSGTTATRTSAVSARSATTARSATATRAPAPAATTTARAATAGRTTVARSATTSTASSPVVTARAGTTQKVIGTGTKVASATENVIVSEACRQKYMGCMDSFCMLDNDSGGRCICSDKNAELDTVLAEIEKLDQQSYQMATFGVEKIEMGADADAAIANANAVADSILNQQEEKKSLDLSLWDSNFNFDDEDVFDVFAESENAIEGKEGDALYRAANEICVAQVPECASELSMLQLMYSQQIKSDCTAYENSLKQQKTASSQKLMAAEKALRDAALDQYRTANKYDLGQCTVAFKDCMISTGGCGDDFSKCATVMAIDNTNVTSKNKKTQSYKIQGEVTSIEISASTYDTLISKKPLCENVTKSCVAVADQVWDTFLKEVAPQIKSAELIAEDNARQNCIGSISDCFQKACKDNIDPNDPDGSYDMCLTRPGTMLNLCKIPLNACGIDTTSAEDAEKEPIWEFVVARLASMRVNSCTTQVKECLQSEDVCGEDYTQCIGLDTDTIIRMCPYDKLVGCQQVYGESNIKGDAVYDELADMVQGIMLNIDNNMLAECQKAADEAMIKVCGNTENCDGLTVDENVGARSLEYKICEYGDDGVIDYTKCRTGVSADNVSVYGDNKTKQFAVVFDGTIDWDEVNIDIDDKGKVRIAGYDENSFETDGSVEQKEKIQSELAVLQSNINAALDAINADPKVQYCITGREVQGMGEKKDGRKIINRNEETPARFPKLTEQMGLIIANSALKIAKDNYYKKYDEFLEKRAKDYVTFAEKDKEQYAMLMCSNFYEENISPVLSISASDIIGKVLTGNKVIEGVDYKRTIKTNFDSSSLTCHKCVIVYECKRLRNSWTRRYCVEWEDPVETCTDIQF